MRHAHTDRKLHHQHVKGARAWVKDTQGQDWRLVSTVRHPDTGEWIYHWRGPHGSNATRTIAGTHRSIMFLAGLHDAMRAYRHAMALKLGDEYNRAARPAPASEPAPVTDDETDDAGYFLL